MVFSDWVRDRLRDLAEQAIHRGDGEAFTAALNEFYRRLRVYPPFGDPLFDLTNEQGQVRNGIIRPIAMRYGVYEDRRLVLVVAQPILLPQHRPDQHGP